MNRLRSIIENIYSGISLNSSSKFIFDQDTIMTEYNAKVNSRFRLKKFNYCPYYLNEGSFTRLFNSILVVPNLWKVHSWKEQNLIIESNQSFVMVYSCDDLKDLLYNNDLTTDGLFALRLGRFFGNFEFKSVVESQILNFRSPFSFNNITYYVDPTFESELETYPERALKLILPKIGFYWRDK